MCVRTHTHTNMHVHTYTHTHTHRGRQSQHAPCMSPPTSASSCRGRAAPRAPARTARSGLASGVRRGSQAHAKRISACCQPPGPPGPPEPPEQGRRPARQAKRRRPVSWVGPPFSLLCPLSAVHWMHGLSWGRVQSKRGPTCVLGDRSVHLPHCPAPRRSNKPALRGPYSKTCVRCLRETVQA